MYIQSDIVFYCSLYFLPYLIHTYWVAAWYLTHVLGSGHTRWGRYCHCHLPPHRLGGPSFLNSNKATGAEWGLGEGGRDGDKMERTRAREHILQFPEIQTGPPLLKKTVKDGYDFYFYSFILWGWLVPTVWPWLLRRLVRDSLDFPHLLWRRWLVFVLLMWSLPSLCVCVNCTVDCLGILKVAQWFLMVLDADTEIQIADGSPEKRRA